MSRRTLASFALLILSAITACSSEDDSSSPTGAGGGGQAGTGATSSGGATSGGGTSGSGGASAGAGGSAGVVATGGSAGSGVGGASGSGGASVVGNPELFTDSVLEMDFSQGQYGRFRANGGAWEDFESWNEPGEAGIWENVGVHVQTTNAVRTELVPNALGSGKVLRTWIEPGDEWHSGATYPRTELTSTHTAKVQFGTEWRIEMPFYVTGDVDSSGSSIIGFQFHQNGNTGSPPFSFGLSSGKLRFTFEDTPAGPAEQTYLFDLVENTLVDLVVELRFGYPADGAYIRLWANGTKYVDITDRKIGYPDLETSAGYWKYCSLYDWNSLATGTRSVHSGPVVKLLKRP